MGAFDGRRAQGFTRWLLRQRQRRDAVAELAHWAHAEPDWPYTAHAEEAFVALVEERSPQQLGTLARAWGEFQARSGLDLELDWNYVLIDAGPAGSRPNQDAEPSIAWAHPKLARLVLAARMGDTEALRALAIEGRRRSALEVLVYVRDRALTLGDWSLVCDLLASGDEALLESTYQLALREDNRYLLDRTLELGSEPFLRDVYERARTVRDWQHQHIALAALKALIPEGWQGWLPESFHHPAELGSRSDRPPLTLPPLPDTFD